MFKADLRKQAIAQRMALSEEELLSLNEKLLERFKTLDFSNINSIHFFLPIAKKKEPDTFLLISWLQENYPGIHIVVPKADFNTNAMTHHVYTHKSDLVSNAYHIPEPQSIQAYTGNFDMVIVPLLAFDKKGYRVGYGKGFYDRFLQGLNAQKIGLSFFNGVKEIYDVHLNDIRLDKCIIPQGIIDFN